MWCSACGSYSGFMSSTQFLWRKKQTFSFILKAFSWTVSQIFPQYLLSTLDHQVHGSAFTPSPVQQFTQLTLPSVKKTPKTYNLAHISSSLPLLNELSENWKTHKNKVFHEFSWTFTYFQSMSDTIQTHEPRIIHLRVQGKLMLILLTKGGKFYSARRPYC